MNIEARRPILVVTSERATGEPLVRDLHHLKQIAIWIDSCEVALEMLQIVEFALVIVDVDGPADWTTCRRIITVHSCPVAIVTRFLARSRRYRICAFEMGVTVYACKPCSCVRLREMLKRMRLEERSIELVDGAAYCEW